MSGKTVSVVYRKELLELVRDRRTLVSMVLVPIIAIPLLFFVMQYFISSSEKQAAQEAINIAVPPRIGMPGLEDTLKAAGFHLVPASDLRAAVGPKKAAAGIEATRNEAGEAVVRLYVDGSRGASDVAAAKLRVALGTLKDAQVRAALAGSRVSEKVLTPFTIAETDVAPKGKKASQTLGGLIGYMLILMIFSGCMYPSIDMTAGEKERRTIEILLSSRAGRDEIVLGKILAASTAAFVTGALNVFSLTVSFQTGMMGEKIRGFLQGVHLNASGVALLLIAVVPTAITAAAVMITISSFAKSFKEGQSYLSPLIMVVVFPAVIGLLPGMDANPRLALLPVFNVSQLIKSIFAGDYTAAAFVVSFASNFVYAAVAFAIAVRIYQREDVLFRT
ncbi:MAG TPA: ABC transporter permease subunit [Candidatus Sulfopaludibacter sp.]|nr:ABC transporter permease subunit [Candidatus Sulfopaludibacter sp.]